MDARSWFVGWLAEHKARNPHNGWRAYEDRGFEVVYLGWIKAFCDLGITREEATTASEQLQRESDLWPRDHLPRLLAVLSPLVARRNRVEAYQRDADARREKLERQQREAAEEGERSAARVAFLSLPSAEIEARLASIRDRFPFVETLSRFAERLAVDEFRGLDLGEPVAWVKPTDPAPVGESSDPPLTPGQQKFYLNLTPGQRSAFRAMSHARRRELIAPHADGFQPWLVAVAAAELDPSVR